MFAAYRLRDHQAPHCIGPASLGGYSALVLILSCLASCEANRFDAADNAAATTDDSGAPGGHVDAAMPVEDSTGFVPGPDTLSTSDSKSTSSTEATATEATATATAHTTGASSHGATSNVGGTASSSDEGTNHDSVSDGSLTDDSNSAQPTTADLSSSDATNTADSSLTGSHSTASGSTGSSSGESTADTSARYTANSGSSETLSDRGSETSEVTPPLTLDLSSRGDAGPDASTPTSEATGNTSDLDASATEPSETLSETSTTSASSTLGTTTSSETEATSAPPLVCTVTRLLPGVVRDFSEDHPDMEPCDDEGIDCRSEKGLIHTLLGDDDKPQLVVPLSEGAPIHSVDSFSQWFNDVEGVNTSTPFDLQITVQRYRAPVKIGFDSANPPAGSPEGFGKDPKGFFPIDQLNTTTRPHNYSFTYEVATYVEYTGGETLTVKGDDDIFVFLNRHLVIDLGGIHLPEEATINFDNLASELGLEPGNVYDLRLFFAERHVEQSNLFLSTTARFMNCTPASN